MHNIEIAQQMAYLILDVKDRETAETLFHQNLELQWNINLALSKVKNESGKDSCLKEGMEMFREIYRRKDG